MLRHIMKGKNIKSYATTYKNKREMKELLNLMNRDLEENGIEKD